MKSPWFKPPVSRRVLCTCLPLSHGLTRLLHAHSVCFGPRGTPPDPFLVDTVAAFKSKSQLRLRRVAEGWSLCSAPGQGEIQGFKAFRYLTIRAFACVGFGLTNFLTKYRRCISLELTACSCSWKTTSFLQQVLPPFWQRQRQRQSLIYASFFVRMGTDSKLKAGAQI